MSKKINVNPDHYKTKGRERQGEDIVQKFHKTELRENRKRVRQNFIPGAAPVGESPKPPEVPEPVRSARPSVSAKTARSRSTKGGAKKGAAKKRSSKKRSSRKSASKTASKKRTSKRSAKSARGSKKSAKRTSTKKRTATKKK